ncbi:hypothetical protein E7T09_15085 [Deinococcus sp. KSM4-11]|uniref:NPCBM/NEW2 domain-containing protein n=1 Tax=Deinococcus sp. KSM4-11 TaxID=2568654 RepID=UPI0010A4F3D4|nr:NPCBM/NEW2 domain-containing protein [Deinococcus sp. KSM4-11]THF85839.1 hypothetical protein E7T09_15085 [Deinococcus sp. KSM4-11]
MTRPPAHLPLALLFTGLLAACSQTPAPSTDEALPPGSPYANGASYPWSDRLEAPVADPYAAGRDYPWTSPTASSVLDAQGLNSGVNYLSDLPWTSASNFWGPVARDRSNGEQDVNDGHTLTLGGQTFAKGLGVHADSTIKYALNAQCSTFSASIGIDDEVGKLGRASFQVLGDGKVLATSAELTGTDSAKALSVNVSGVKELTLNVLKGATTYYDHADWADAKVTCQALEPSGTVYVSDLAYTSATNGWGPVEIDRSNGEQKQFDGRPLTVNGDVFAKGLGVHSGSAITYGLGGACQAFVSGIAIDDETQGRGTVMFQVYGDGRKLFESPTLGGNFGTPLNRVAVDLTGVQQLRLVVTDAGDGKSFDHADWVDAKLACTPAGTSGATDPAFGTNGHANVGSVDSVVEPGNSVVLLGKDFSVKRLSSAGTVSAAGAVSVPGGTASAIARQANGNLVAVGQANNMVVVVRYLPTLQPDPSFGTGGVKVMQYGVMVNDVPAASSARDVTVQADGKVVLVGTSTESYLDYDVPGSTLDYLIARLNVDGLPDPTFGQDGKFTLSSSSYTDCLPKELDDLMTAVAVQADGRIVAAGNSDCVGGYVPTVLRLTADGKLDPTFSGDGIAFASPQGDNGYGDFTRALLVQPDGKIVIGGATQRFQTTAFIGRLTAAGEPDGGLVFQIADNFYDVGSVYSLARQNDGKIVFGALSPNLRHLGRLNADLTLDTSFGGLGTGYLYLDTAVTSVNIDPVGRIVASGTTDTVRVLP